MDFMKTPLSDFEENWVGYDVNSLMHYGEDAFTKNGKKTITFKDPDITLNTGQRLRPTTKGQFFMRVTFSNFLCLQKSKVDRKVDKNFDKITNR